MLTVHPEIVLDRNRIFPWVVTAMHPVVGMAMLHASFLVWRHCTKAVLFYFWILVAVICAAAPFTVMLTLHYGK